MIDILSQISNLVMPFHLTGNVWKKTCHLPSARGDILNSLTRGPTIEIGGKPTQTQRQE